MKLLFDANLSPGLIERLADLFPGSEHVSSFGLDASDTAIWNHARSQQFVIVSKDSDFQQRAMVFGTPPKIVWIRLGNCRTALVESLLRQRFEQLQAFVEDPTEALLALP
jgi:predicted nuclease of predicted toxin-antitoxin system